MTIIRSGGHYSNDLEPGDEEIFDYKRPLHIVSASISIVGISNQKQIRKLYVAYPKPQEKLRILNKQFVSYSKKFCKKYLASNSVEYSADNIIEFIADHYSYSTHLIYDSVRQKCKHIDLKSDDTKKYYIIIQQRQALLKSQTLHRSSYSQENSA